MELTDPRAMRAMAHPLRLALMDLLTQEGTATATRCAEVLGESQASCSFHLRQLAKYGYVEQVASEDKRSRPWRIKARAQSWSDVQDDAETEIAARELTRVYLEREVRKLLTYERTSQSYDVEWRRSAGMSGADAWVTPEELAGLMSKITELFRTFQDRITDPSQRPDGARLVRLFAAGYLTAPVPEV